MADRPRVVLEVEFLPGPVPWEVRCRRLVKALARGYGARIVGYQEVPGGPQAAAPAEDGPQAARGGPAGTGAKPAGLPGTGAWE
jgi:hypothetical protein